MLPRGPVKIHASIEETFVFGEKKKPLLFDDSSKDKKVLCFRNHLIENQKYIYPIYKLYYKEYKIALSKVEKGSFRENLYDFLCLLVQKGRKGEYFFLENLYSKPNITPAIFSSFYPLLDTMNPFFSFSISLFLKQKEKAEMEEFHLLSSFINSLEPIYMEDGEIFYFSDSEVFRKFPCSIDCYQKIFQKKAVDPSIRREIFTFFYQVQMPFTSSDLLFFLTSSHLEKERFCAFLNAFGVSFTQFEKVFAMSVCINPKLKEIYLSYLKKGKKEEKEVRLFPRAKQMASMKEKLLQIQNYKKRVL